MAFENFSFVSKIIKRVVVARLSEHAETHQLLPKRQWAYRPYHATERAVTVIHNNLVRNVDKSGKVSVPVLLDLSSAFDTVDHTILLAVLEQRFGVKGLTLDWYRSYLSDRTQTFQVKSDSSIAIVWTVVYHKVQYLAHLNLWLTLRTFLQWSNSITSTTTSTPTTRSSRAIHPSHESPMQSRTLRTTSKALTKGVPSSDSSTI